MTNVGGSQAHLNMQPFLTLNFCIALQGIFPSARPKEETTWHNPTSVRSGCSRATSPRPGWMFCEGQLLPISENETLFQLIGTTYGGDGESTFALPDLRGRLPIHQGNGFILAETGGAEEITLTVEPDPGAHATRSSAPTSTGHDANAGGNVAGRARAVNVDLYIDGRAEP